MLRVVVADDEARVCQLILMLADWDSLGMEVVGTAGNGLEALELVERLHPDILITDIRMPGCHGLELIQRAKEKFPQLEIVIISGYAHFEFAQTAIKYGVGDYLLKPIKREELMSTLEKLGQRQEAVRKHLRGCLDQLLAQRTIFGPLEFSLAPGPTADRVEDLPGCAQAARWAAADRLTQGTGRLLEGGPYPPALDRDQLLEQYRRTMERGWRAPARSCWTRRRTILHGLSGTPPGPTGGRCWSWRRERAGCSFSGLSSRTGSGSSSGSSRTATGAASGSGSFNT